MSNFPNNISKTITTTSATESSLAANATTTSATLPSTTTTSATLPSTTSTSAFLFSFGTSDSITAGPISRRRPSASRKKICTTTSASTATTTTFLFKTPIWSTKDIAAGFSSITSTSVFSWTTDVSSISTANKASTSSTNIFSFGTPICSPKDTASTFSTNSITASSSITSSTPIFFTTTSSTPIFFTTTSSTPSFFTTTDVSTISTGNSAIFSPKINKEILFGGCLNISQGEIVKSSCTPATNVKDSCSAGLVLPISTAVSRNSASPTNSESSTDTFQSAHDFDDNTQGDMEVVKVSYMWKIREFSKVCRNYTTYINSPTFSKRYKCSLFLVVPDDAFDYFSLGLKCGRNYQEIRKCNTSLINDNMDEEYKISVSGLSRTNVLQLIQIDAICNETSNLLPNDTLSILCEIYTSDITATSLSPFEKNLQNDLGQLLESKKFSDLTLQVGNAEFKVHKYILAARSAKFSKMFEDGKIGDDDKYLKIDKISPEVMKEVLYYIYTERVRNLSELAVELLCAAHEYQLDKLKSECEITLCNQISVHNAVQFYILAEQYNAKHLRYFTLKYIITNAKNIVGTKDYDTLTASYPHLLSELFCELAKRT